MKALIIIDVQNDFIPGGALAVPNGDEIIELINQLQEKFNLVVATQDWHPENHASFAVNQPDGKEFDIIELNGEDQVLWPVHCVQNSTGAELHPDLKTDRIENIIQKGTNPKIDSYSGFYDNAHLKSTGLYEYLKEKGADQLYFCGLAGDFCVFYSVIDALEEGFTAYLIEDATRSLDGSEFVKAKNIIEEKGGKIVESSDLL
ncbi:bifunctional nicotinamidase/pyrazinamidase [Leeuwenhoekiella sp. A16]|uniref:bifunctional nicotinamidase/pyrazinamidase n=1 Tax=unclassified Leeuwenhoekiella TaxID=2615029 RepID=UPI003A810048